MKGLFITFNNIDSDNFGGGQCSKRNFEVLKKYSEIELYSIEKKSTLQSFFSILEYNFPPVRNKDYKNICNLIKEKKFDFVFFDNSLLGSIAKKIKIKFGIPIITFFHNIESDYLDVRFGSNKRKYLYKILAISSEKKITQYSDKVICLNKRDNVLLKESYGRAADCIIPITFEDKFSNIDILSQYKNIKNDIDPYYLFVGSLTKSNYEGILWFSKNVSPYIPIKLKIVGKDFESVKSNFTEKNIEVIGTVDDIKNYYMNAEFVISPLLSGAGMKVKIAEALMYGKTIFATTESFEGYNYEDKEIGKCCNSKNEFIKEILEYIKNEKKFNAKSRSLFKEKYSHNSVLDKFERLVNDFEGRNQ